MQVLSLPCFLGANWETSFDISFRRFYKYHRGYLSRRDFADTVAKVARYSTNRGQIKHGDPTRRPVSQSFSHFFSPSVMARLTDSLT